MSGLIAEIDADVQEAANEAANGGGDGIYPPVPKGKYQAVIVPLDKEGTPLKVQDFGGSGLNSKKQVVRLAFKIVDESPTGKGRVFFGRVPLFSRFVPKPGEAKGKTARGYFDFFERAIGVPTEQVLAGQLPGPEGILGRRVTITLSAPVEPRNQDDLDKWNPLGSNEIDFYDAPGDVSSTPLVTPGQPLAPWLTPDNKALVPGYVFAFQKAQQAAQEAAAAYTGGAAAAGGWGAPTAGAWAQPAAQPAAAEPGQVTPGPWGQQNPALQQAAAAGSGW